MKNPTILGIATRFAISIFISAIGFMLAVNRQDPLIGCIAMSAAFFAGWQTRHDLFIIEFKEMLDLVKKVSDYDKTIVDKEK